MTPAKAAADRGCRSEATPAATAPILDDNAVFTAATLRLVFPFMKDSSIRHAIRKRQLRASRRCGHYVFLGSWVREWIELGELGRKATPSAEPCQCADDAPAPKPGKAKRGGANHQ